MPRELSNASDIATEYQNVAGRESAILTFQPEDGTGLVIDGLVAKGEEVGIPIFGKLFAEDGSEMPLDTTLAWKFEAPGDDDATTITHPESNIRAYRTLSIEDQQHADNIDAVKHVLKGTQAAVEEGNTPQVAVGHLDELSLVATSGKVIDWTNPETRVYVYKNAVREV